MFGESIFYLRVKPGEFLLAIHLTQCFYINKYLQGPVSFLQPMDLQFYKIYCIDLLSQDVNKVVRQMRGQHLQNAFTTVDLPAIWDIPQSLPSYVTSS